MDYGRWHIVVYWFERNATPSTLDDMVAGENLKKSGDKETVAARAIAVMIMIIVKKTKTKIYFESSLLNCFTSFCEVNKPRFFRIIDFVVYRRHNSIEIFLID